MSRIIEKNSNLYETLLKSGERSLMALEALSMLTKQQSQSPDFQRLIQTILLTLSGQFSVTNTFALYNRPGKSDPENGFFATGKFKSRQILQTLVFTPQFCHYFYENDSVLPVSELNLPEDCTSHQAILNDNGVSLILPLVHEDSFYGILGIGERINMKSFQKDDIELLSFLLATIKPIIVNSYHFFEMKRLSAWHVNLLNNVKQGVFVFNSDNRLLNVNHTGVYIRNQITGINKNGSEFEGISIHEVFEHQAFPNWAQLFIKASFENKDFIINDLIAEVDGSNHYYEAYIKKIADRSGFSNDFIITIDDVTERRGAEMALEESEKKHRIISGLTTDYAYSFQVSPDSSISLEWVTEAFTRITGYDKGDVDTHDKIMNNLIHPDDHKIILIRNARIFSNHTDESIFRIVTKAGDIRVVQHIDKPIWGDKEKRVVGVIGAGKDITEQRRAEEMLRLTQFVLDRASEAIYWLTPLGHLHYFNDAACNYLQYDRNEMQSLTVFDIDTNLTFEQWQKHWARLREEKNFTFEAEQRRKDGTFLPVEITVNFVEFGEQQFNCAFARDISERKRAEKQEQDLRTKLERAERMESLAILAGGVAHDLNNMLGPLVGYPELILMKLPDGSPVRKQIEKISTSAQQASDIVQDLLTLARRGRYDMAPCDINAVMENYLDSVNFEKQRQKHCDINLSWKPDRSIGKILGSVPHLDKVFMNLIVNAIDAMPDGGELIIETAQKYYDCLIGGYEKIENGEYITLIIKDTGIGIDADDLNKIFEPYYSKKKIGSSGSGLGLSVVYGIVKDHKGYYDIFSEKGKGTSFILYFPLTGKKAEMRANKEIPVGNGQTILVVDDSPEQRELASEILVSLGYKAVLAENGRKAVEYLSDHGTDLVILDMIMEKGFDGLDTYREIIKKNPGQKALIVSGFSETDRVKKMQELGAGKYIRKPYTRKTLAQEIKTELENYKAPV